MPTSEDRLSLFNLLYPVDVTIPEGVNSDPTEDEVQFNFVLGGLPARARPVDADWVTGGWTTLANGLILATLLVGPGGHVVPVGKWAVWIRVVDNPTVPVAAIDVLTIT